MRSQPATACSAVSTCALRSSTSAVSSSKHRTPGGQGSRKARASNPAPSRTTCRQPSWPAETSNSSRNTVRATTQVFRAAARRSPGGLADDHPDAATKAPARGSAKSRSGRAVSAARIAATARPVPPTPSSGGPPDPGTPDWAPLAAAGPARCSTASLARAAMASARSRDAGHSRTTSESAFRPMQNAQHSRTSGRARTAPPSRASSPGSRRMCSR